MKIEEWESILKKRLSDKRYAHTLRVREEAIRLAGRWGADEKKAELAALLHDFCRNLSVEESDELVREYGLDKKYLGNVSLAHSQIAARLLPREYGVEDPEILSAVSHHTTGGLNMTVLDKIIYLADTIEPGRRYPGVDELREMAYNDLDKACLSALDRSIRFVRSKGERMDNSALAWKMAEVIDSKKGREIAVIDVSEISGFADYLIVTHAPSERLMKTIADELEDKMAELGVILERSEGKNGSGWILLDFGDIIVNVFTPEQREKYNLEKLWGDGHTQWFHSENK